MRNKRAYWLPALILLAGLSLLLYPTIRNARNRARQGRVILNYQSTVSTMDAQQKADMLAAAEAYNSGIPDRENLYLMTDELLTEAHSLLTMEPGGPIARVDIPSIDISYAVYHGTDETVLQSGIGHIDWSSLPVGGESTHCVLSGHRGLPGAKLFTDLDELTVGDRFTVTCLDRVLTYEVDRILIVEPDDVSALQIVPGMDYCTLVTCTPYGINTHRLLVRGHRIENPEEQKSVYVTSEATQVDPLVVAPLLMIPALMAVLIRIWIKDRRKRGGRRRSSEDME